MGGFRSDVEEQMARQNEEMAVLKSQMRAQKFEIESDLMKKVKYHQSQHDLKLDEFYKFKADIYSYMDNKYETMTGTYGTKFKGIQDFIESAENKIRALMDVKSNSELHIEEFMSKYSTKLSTLEDSFHALSNKNSGLEAAQYEMNGHINRMKKSVQEIVRDRTITQRVELLESKIHDDFLKGHIGMQIEITLSERLKHLMTD